MRDCSVKPYSASLVAVLNHDNPHDPQTKAEVKQIAEVCLYAGVKIPTKCYGLLDAIPPMPPRYVYSAMPIFETRGHVRRYSVYRDGKLNLQYDEGNRRCIGGTSTVGDVKENSLFAKELGMSLGKIEDEDDEDAEEEDDQDSSSDDLIDRVVGLEHALDLAVEEVRKARYAFSSEAKKLPAFDRDFHMVAMVLRNNGHSARGATFNFGREDGLDLV